MILTIPMEFSSKEKIVWALRFMELPEKSGLITKKKYTTLELSDLLGISNTYDRYDPNGFLSNLKKSGALKPNGIRNSRFQLFTLDKKIAFDFFMQYDVFKKMKKLFMSKFLAGEF